MRAPEPPRPKSVPVEHRCPPLEALSPMQEAYCELINEGYSVPQIADAFGCGPATVHEQLRRAGRKLPSHLPRSLKIKLWVQGFDLRTLGDLGGLPGKANIGSEYEHRPTDPIDATLRVARAREARRQRLTSLARSLGLKL